MLSSRDHGSNAGYQRFAFVELYLRMPKGDVHIPIVRGSNLKMPLLDIASSGTTHLRSDLAAYLSAPPPSIFELLTRCDAEEREYATNTGAAQGHYNAPDPVAQGLSVLDMIVYPSWSESGPPPPEDSVTYPSCPTRVVV
jgi:hypothetical protein